MIGIALLGATGSIGSQTLDVIRRLHGRFTIRALAAGRHSAEFERLLTEWPDAAAWSAAGRPAGLAGRRWAHDGLEGLATTDGVDLVVVATTGMTALPAVLAALAAGRRVALANKETLVAGGHLVTRAVDAAGGDPLDRLRPIDSEHSAIWQCLAGEDPRDVTGLVLTASGGPFLDLPSEAMARVTPGEAMAHPTWRMGPKVTVDSATLVNKAFEAIEARWLYRLPYSKIAAVIHPQSVVHSLVEFVDGSFKAQLGLPDMRVPIQYALTYPHRLPSPAHAAPPEAWPPLEFRPVDDARYPAYRAVLDAAERGGNRGAVVNAADEAAVAAFLAGRIAFGDIARVIADAVDRWASDHEPGLAELTTLDGEVRAALDADLAA
ncbi:MAG: 1-deoxy-D-xylulose-5-phosphate reductoisomerase [Chloroflexota bacterium]|nr:1-deoxy-D-xylulose-5-phosphate reductoisomerase [Chloroflexota bacterium]